MINELKFIFSIKNPTQLKNTRKDDFSLIYSFDTEFFIFADHNVFFHDKYFNVFEMIAELKNNIERIEEIEHFAFKSVDYDEPLLEFNKCSDTTWELKSIWSSVENEKIYFSTEMLKKAYKELCYNANKYLRR